MAKNRYIEVAGNLYLVTGIGYHVVEDRYELCFSAYPVKTVRAFIQAKTIEETIAILQQQLVVPVIEAIEIEDEVRLEVIRLLYE